MKLSISNIAWAKEYDNEIYEYLGLNVFSGLEIAPTRIIETEPYEQLETAKEFADTLKNKHKLEIPSMQSIWYGKKERLFGDLEEKNELLCYTKKAIDFASIIKCKNLVFGCPKNRIIDDKKDIAIAISFFKELGEYAVSKDTCIGIEANPSIYGTNFLNTTDEVVDFVKEVNSEGVKINLDLGTVIYNNEKFIKDISLINHIHISEPNLEKIQKREIHLELLKLLKENNYNKYVSIEMKNLNDINIVKETIQYIKENFK